MLTDRVGMIHSEWQRGFCDQKSRTKQRTVFAL